MRQELETTLVINKDLIESPNLVDRFTDNDLKHIGRRVKEGFDLDQMSREPWERRMNAAMDLAMQIQKVKNFPWPNASNVVFPLVTISALQFSARAYSNIIQGTEIFKFRIPGSDSNGDIQKVADMIGKHMSWQVLEEDVSWEEQHDRLLINLAIVGTNFVKTYYSPGLRHNVSELVMARDFVLDYWAKSVEECSRKTQCISLYTNEIYEKVKSGLFADILDEGWYKAGPTTPEVDQQRNKRLGRNEPPQHDPDQPFVTLEQHRYFDFDKDGYAEPYIVTIEQGSQEVLRIVARFDREEDVERNSRKEIIRINPTEYYTKYSFIPAPDGGIYDVGFGVLLGPLNESVNTGINQIMDCGTMMNANGGFLGRGAKIRGGVYTMAPWEWKRVDSTGDDLRKSMVPFPTKEPSSVMFQVISLLINYTDRVSGSTDTLVGENPGQNTPAYTSRNMTEQGMKVFNVIHKRVWRSMKEEGKKLFKLNSVFLRTSQPFGSNGERVSKEMYLSNSDLIVPAADPHLTSDSERMMQASLISQRAAVVPGYSIPDTERNFLRAARVEGIDRMYPGPDKIPPPPSEKVQIEQMKLQMKQLQLTMQQKGFVMGMMEARKKIMAEVTKLEAEAMAITAGITAEEKAQRIAAFDSVVNMMKHYNDALNARIEAMNGDDDGGGEGGGGSPAKGGAIPQLASPALNGGSFPAAPDMAQGPDGAVGGGSV